MIPMTKPRPRSSRLTKVPGGVDATLEGYTLTVSGKDQQGSWRAHRERRRRVGCRERGYSGDDREVVEAPGDDDGRHIKVQRGSECDRERGGLHDRSPDPLVILDTSVQIGQGTASGEEAP